MRLIGQFAMYATWASLCGVIRHEYIQWKRHDGRGWGGPGW